jgi:hypothetical protein
MLMEPERRPERLAEDEGLRGIAPVEAERKVDRWMPKLLSSRT